MVKGKVSRTVAVLVSIMMWVVMFLGMPEIKVKAAYENTHVNTGNQAEDIVAVAETQIGYKEGANNDTKYNRWNGTISGYPVDGYGYPWCHCFVSWCANQAGIPTSVIPRTAGTSTGRSFFVNQGTYKQSKANGGSYVPKRGDIIYFGSGSSPSHVGIVASCDGSTVHTIEGNYSDSVGRRSIALSNSYIIGYGVPNYNGSSTLPTPSLATPTISTEKSSYNVGDTVYLSWTASPSGSNLSHYWLNITAPDGTTILNKTMNKNTSYSFVVSQSGSYNIIASATPIGSVAGEGSLESSKTITVNNATCIVKFVDYGTNYSSSKSVTIGGTYGTLPTLTRDGYTFCGWFKDSNGGAEVTSSTIVSDTSNHSLYAHWTVASNAPDYPVASYYADLNFDGRSTVFDISIIKYIINGNKTPTVTEKIYADLNGDGSIDQKDENIISRIYLYTMDDDEVRAAFNKWKTKYLDTVYHLIPLDTEYVGFFSISIKQGHQYGSLPTASRKGYEFNGWYADGITPINSKSVFTVDDYPISSGGIFYDCGIDAKWIAKKYTVTFDAQGGTCPTTSQTVQYDSTYGSLPTPTRLGYSFNGWYDSNDVAIISSTAYKTDSNQVLYAHWTPNSYTVSFDPNGGLCSEKERTVLADETYGALPEPTRTGYNFDGWYTEKESGSKVTAGTEVSKLASVTLYAHWTVKSYCIVFHVDEDISSVRLVSYYSSYGTLEDPAEWGYTKNGYVFDGWYTEEIGGSKVTANTLATEDKDLYAHWRIGSCTVTFDPQGGECGLDKKNVTYGETYGTLPTVLKVGYDLDGWYTKKVGGSKITSYTQVFELNSTNLTLYAHWKEKSYHITFHVDGDIPSERLVSYRSPYGTLEDPAEWGYTKDGYEFDGWYTKETGGLKVTANTLVMGDCDLYAQWKKIEQDATLYGDVDCNGSVDVMDCILLNRNLMIGAEVSEQGLLNADVDNSGNTDAVDSLNILKAVVKLITLPV